MTKTDAEQTQAPTMLDWIEGACNLFTADAAADRHHRLRGTPPSALDTDKASMPEQRIQAGIAPQDWDILFRAALEFLADVAIEKPAPGRTGLRLQRPGTSLLQCLDALDQLRMSVPFAPFAPFAPCGQSPKAAQATGGVADPVPTPPTGLDD